MDYTYFGEFVLSGKWFLWLVFAYFVLPLAVYLFVPLVLRRKSATDKTVSIFVLGDIGHSPRMCYHALSFSSLDFSVNFCGYIETAPPVAVMDEVNIDIYPIQAIKNGKNLPYLIFAVKKILQQTKQLFAILLDLRGNEYFILQNPPSMPLLGILVVFIKLFSPSSKLIIDWHNLNYTILNLKYGNLSHPVVRLMRLYEKTLSRYAWLHITVTTKMKDFLTNEFGIDASKIVVLHDRPGPQFKPLEASQKNTLLRVHSLFTGVSNIESRKILVSATSFTPDEDFDILLSSLKIYDDDIHRNTPIMLVVTGKGPLKEQFLKRVSDLAFSHKVVIKSAWLSSEEYPQILGVADMAVSLHTSSSGIDLPMKILDFFGVGVPVITLAFPAIGELVNDRKNGLITKSKTKAELPEEMSILLSEVLEDENLLRTLKEGALEESCNRWNENWAKTVGQYFHREK